MKYVCLAYEEESKLDFLTQTEWDALRKETLDYVSELQSKGRLIAAEPLQSVKSAATVPCPRWKDLRHRRPVC